MEDKINNLIAKYCETMNEVCWYTSQYKWNKDNLMDTTINECGVKKTCPSVVICKACENNKKDFHDRLNMIIKLNKSKTERKWKKEMSINSQ